MTKIAISPNVNGTGTFTIAAPDSNTDRTLTLPDAGGEVFSQGNIIGTVFQSGGVPTGAIIESGSNANGYFVKFADGTQICTFESSNTITVGPSAEGSLGIWTFPVPFTSRPLLSTTVACDTNRGDTASATGIGFRNYDADASSTQSPTVFLRNFGSDATGTYRLVIQAIGRWF